MQKTHWHDDIVLLNKLKKNDDQEEWETLVFTSNPWHPHSHSNPNDEYRNLERLCFFIFQDLEWRAHLWRPIPIEHNTWLFAINPKTHQNPTKKNKFCKSHQPWNAIRRNPNLSTLLLLPIATTHTCTFIYNLTQCIKIEEAFMENMQNP